MLVYGSIILTGHYFHVQYLPDFLHHSEHPKLVRIVVYFVTQKMQNVKTFPQWLQTATNFNDYCDNHYEWIL